MSPQQASIKQPDIPVHIIDDDAKFRGDLAYELGGKGIPCQQWETGEAFLKDWDWSRRGVITLDIDFAGLGMRGTEVFRELLVRHCPMPVIFLTGPHANDPELVVKMVTSRDKVHFFGKHNERSHLLAVIERFRQDEPAFRESLQRIKDLLQAMLTEMTHTERVVLSYVMQGRSTAYIGTELSISDDVVSNHRNSINRKLGPYFVNYRPLISILLDKMLATAGDPDLLSFAVRELRARLANLDAAQKLAVQNAIDAGDEKRMPKAMRSAPIPDPAVLSSAMTVLQADSLKQVKEWLVWLERVRPRESVWPT